jgi:hypothetical protein
MNTILLEPNDVLFFSDGRPMSGSLAGHGAAWPLPNVVSAALHAALHRAEVGEVAIHLRARSGQILSHDREKHGRKFGAMLSAGPFPVRRCEAGTNCWFFPRPADAPKRGSLAVTLHPSGGLAGMEEVWQNSSLPAPLRFAVRSADGQDKGNPPETWVSGEAIEAYLDEMEGAGGAGHFAGDGDVADREQRIGIEIDPATQSAGRGEAEGKIYSAHYLRLRRQWRLGVVASAADNRARCDLLPNVIRDDRRIVIGGQQRICTAEVVPGGGAEPGPLPLPLGRRRHFLTRNRKWLVKWVLLSPAIWPEIAARTSARGTKVRAHPGGWLPNWVFLDWDEETGKDKPHPDNGLVLLTAGPGLRKAERVRSSAGSPIAARLAAAIVPKPLVVTGWSLGDKRLGSEGHPGAKSTHLAVPAGAVYYFEAHSEAAAIALADALNWHGATPGTEIRNHRSTLMGEKGFGLGVCGTWRFCEEAARLDNQQSTKS